MLRKKEELLLVGSLSIKTNELGLGVVRVGLFVCVCVSVVGHGQPRQQHTKGEQRHKARDEMQDLRVGWMDGCISRGPMPRVIVPTVDVIDLHTS